MKNKTTFAVVAAVLALAFIGAKTATNAPVEVGKNYTISNGAAAVQGKVISELGGGWYQVKRTDGRETRVNLGTAFWVEDLR